jgi:UDP-N-acetyl-2-amino-2-deoxyglucuronate dehydrogenase
MVSKSYGDAEVYDYGAIPSEQGRLMPGVNDIGFGIVGVGVIASFHARALAEIPGARLSACFDIAPERVSAFAAEFDCTPWNSLDQLLADDSVNAVIICTPSGLHLEPALAAAAAGKHLVVEKPLEITTERCDRIIAAARENGVVLSGIFMSRFSEGTGIIKTALDEGRFGRLTVLDAAVKWHRTDEYYAQAGWRGTWAVDGGGAVMNQSIHAVDLLQWFSGGISEVSAYTATLGHDGLEVEDVAVASVLHNSGALGTITGTTSSWPGWAKRIEISGTRGSAVLEDDSVTRWDFNESRPEDKKILEGINAGETGSGGAGDPTAIGWEGHRRQLTDIVEALTEGRDPQVTGEEARKSVAIITAIYRSAESGERTRPD